MPLPGCFIAGPPGFARSTVGRERRCQKIATGDPPGGRPGPIEPFGIEVRPGSQEPVETAGRGGRPGVGPGGRSIGR